MKRLKDKLMKQSRQISPKSYNISQVLVHTTWGANFCLFFFFLDTCISIPSIQYNTCCEDQVLFINTLKCLFHRGAFCIWTSGCNRMLCEFREHIVMVLPDHSYNLWSKSFMSINQCIMSMFHSGGINHNYFRIMEQKPSLNIALPPRPLLLHHLSLKCMKTFPVLAFDFSQAPDSLVNKGMETEMVFFSPMQLEEFKIKAVTQPQK